MPKLRLRSVFGPGSPEAQSAPDADVWRYPFGVAHRAGLTCADKPAGRSVEPPAKPTRRPPACKKILARSMGRHFQPASGQRCG